MEEARSGPSQEINNQHEQISSSPVHVVVFASVFGPLIGGVVVWLAVLVAAIANMNAPNFDVLYALFFIFALFPGFLLFSYYPGVAYAVLTSILIAFISDRDFRFTYLQAMVAAVISGLILWLPAQSLTSSDSTIPAVLLAVSSVSIVAFRFLFRGRFAPSHSDT